MSRHYRLEKSHTGTITLSVYTCPRESRGGPLTIGRLPDAVTEAVHQFERHLAAEYGWREGVDVRLALDFGVPVLELRPDQDADHQVTAWPDRRRRVVHADGGWKDELADLRAVPDGVELQWAKAFFGLVRLSVDYLRERVEHAPFVAELARRCEEGNQAACDALNTAGVEPPELQVDEEPIATPDERVRLGGGELGDLERRLRAYAKRLDAYIEQMAADVESEWDRGAVDALMERVRRTSRALAALSVAGGALLELGEVLDPAQAPETEVFDAEAVLALAGECIGREVIGVYADGDTVMLDFAGGRVVSIVGAREIGVQAPEERGAEVSA